MHRSILASMKAIFRSLLFAPLLITQLYLWLLGNVRPQLASRFNDLIYTHRLQEVRPISHKCVEEGNHVDLILSTPNTLCRWRAESFSTKEPETLAWIEEYGGTGAFFDIGANVGLYSLFYAKLFKNNVYAFEPSVFNLNLLAKNIHLNSMSEQICIIPNALTSRVGIETLHLQNPVEGGSMSSFGEIFGHDGQTLDVEMSYKLLGFSLDSILLSGLLPEAPALMKIDVDGIEHLILKGAKETLLQECLRSVLIEVNDDFGELATGVTQQLSEAGFQLKSKRHASNLDDGEFASCFNQIWVRESHA